MSDKQEVLVVQVVGSTITWGTGDDLAQAKRNFTKYGGALREGYTVYTFNPGLEFTGISGMGSIQWRTRDGSEYDPKNPDHQPVVAEHSKRSKS